jgi:RNA polymerase sigma factor (sigma-70 family)
MAGGAPGRRPAWDSYSRLHWRGTRSEDNPVSTSTPANPRPTPAGGAVFATTHWSVVVAATDRDSDCARTALSHLCSTYWYPLYAYVRRRGYNPPDAQDLTQEFFARLLERNWLARADRERGRFRTFLLAALGHFLANEWDRAHAQKRGGTARVVPLQLDSAETRYGQEPPDPATPDQIFERRWALALLETVLQRLAAECRAEGKADLFETLKPCLVGEHDAQPYAFLAAQLGLTEGALKTTVHRLRQRYRQILREEIASTVAAPEEVEGELRHLLKVLAG